MTFWLISHRVFTQNPFVYQTSASIYRSIRSRLSLSFFKYVELPNLQNSKRYCFFCRIFFFEKRRFSENICSLANVFTRLSWSLNKICRRSILAVGNIKNGSQLSKDDICIPFYILFIIVYRLIFSVEYMFIIDNCTAGS
jgi:hypothetical protein